MVAQPVVTQLIVVEEAVVDLLPEQNPHIVVLKLRILHNKVFFLFLIKKMDSFAARKHQVVSSLVEALDSERRDKSPKGFIDAPVLDLIHIINRHPNYYTTSSCSGRVAVYCEGVQGDKSTTKGGIWLFVTHDPVTIPDDANGDWVTQLLFGSDRRVIRNNSAAAKDILDKQMIYFKFESLVSNFFSLVASMGGGCLIEWIDFACGICIHRSFYALEQLSFSGRLSEQRDHSIKESRNAGNPKHTQDRYAHWIRRCKRGYPMFGRSNLSALVTSHVKRQIHAKHRAHEAV